MKKLILIFVCVLLMGLPCPSTTAEAADPSDDAGGPGAVAWSICR